MSENILHEDGLGKNQLLYREILKRGIPINKNMLGSFSKDIDVGQKLDKSLQRADNMDRIIYGNLNNMIPRLSNRAYMDETADIEKLKRDIELCKMYGRSIYDDFAEKCDYETDKLNREANEREYKKRLRLSNLDKLPYELVRKIFDYVPYVEKISILMDRYNDWEKRLLKMTTPKLKEMYTKLYENHMDISRWSSLKTTTVRWYELTTYLGISDCMSRKRGIYRKGDVIEYIKYFLDKYSVLKVPTSKSEEVKYNILIKENHRLVKTIIYIMKTMVPVEKKRAKKAVSVG